jgi:broad specificity phosphatase PhoE
MELVLVRHGEPAWMVDGRAQYDPGLTERGHSQARCVATRLQQGRPTRALYVSSARRARETAIPVAQALGTQGTVLEALHELRPPDLTDMPAEQLAVLWRTGRARPPQQWWEGWPGGQGEPFRDFHARVVGCLRQLLEERGVVPVPGQEPHLWQVPAPLLEERVVLVCHGGTSAVCLSYLLGVPPTPWEWERFALSHAAMARVRAVPLGGGYIFSLRCCNDQEHIDRSLRSL